MIFYDDIDIGFGRILAQTSQSISRITCYFLWFALPTSIDTNRCTTQIFGTVHPLIMIFYGLHTLGLIGFSKIARSVHHNQMIFDVVVFAATQKVIEISCIFGFVFEHLIHIFHNSNPKFFSCYHRKIKICEFFFIKNSFV